MKMYLLPSIANNTSNDIYIY